jgi:hypothetical protein
MRWAAADALVMAFDLPTRGIRSVRLMLVRDRIALLRTRIPLPVCRQPRPPSVSRWIWSFADRLFRILTVLS